MVNKSTIFMKTLFLKFTQVGFFDSGLHCTENIRTFA